MKTTNQLRPVQINDLIHINNVQKLSTKDKECLDELRGILEKHNRLSKFGITLLHKHFDLHADELLVEHCDTAARTLTAKPVKIENLNGNGNELVETVWRFDEIAGKKCEKYCPRGKDGKHYGYNDHRG